MKASARSKLREATAISLVSGQPDIASASFLAMEAVDRMPKRSGGSVVGAVKADMVRITTLSW